MELFGFIIDSETQFDIANKRLVRVSGSISGREFSLGAVGLSKSMVRLLTYLLIHAREEPVSKIDILDAVWGEGIHTLSSQRLWQTVKELRNKLTLIGLSKDLILSVRGQGYIIGDHHIVKIFV